MQRAIKTANRLETAWTTFVMLPAFILLANAAVSLHQGTATPAELTSAAQNVATDFGNQYTPYIKGTSNAILSGVEKLSNIAASCFGGASPVYTDPAMASRSNCALSRTASTAATIKPYRAY